jgi:hypothetical protein
VNLNEIATVYIHHQNKKSVSRTLRWGQKRAGHFVYRHARDRTKKKFQDADGQAVYPEYIEKLPDKHTCARHFIRL